MTIDHTTLESRRRQGPSADAEFSDDPFAVEPTLLDQSFGLAFDSASIGMAVVHLNGRYLRVNRGLCNFLGYSQEELCSRSFQSVTHPDDLEIDLGNRRALLDGRMTTVRREKRYLHKDGSIVWSLLDVALMRDDAGEPLYFISQATDITSLKAAEHELRAQTAELRALHDTTLALLDRPQPDDVLVRIVRSAADLAETSNGYVYVLDREADSLVVRVGIGIFAESIGYQLRRGEGIAGRAWELARAIRSHDYRTLPKPRDEWDSLRAVLAVPLMIRSEVIGVIGLAHPEGEQPDGEQPGFTAAHEQQLTRFAQLASLVLDNARYARDLETLNRELRDADHIKDQFVAMASHELRTPLTNILGYTKTLLSRWNSLQDEDRFQHVEIVDRNADRLYDLVADLLLTSRIENGALDMQPVRVDIARAIASAIGMVQGADAIDVSCEEGIVAFADPLRVEQILVNYITNALKHGAPPFRVEARGSGGGVVIVVADEGAGVPDDFRARLFQRFAQAEGGLTRKAQGTGLGLSIVRALARAMGGDAWYEPNLPQGSRFGVRLPGAET